MNSSAWGARPRDSAFLIGGVGFAERAKKLSAIETIGTAALPDPHHAGLFAGSRRQRQTADVHCVEPMKAGLADRNGAMQQCESRFDLPAPGRATSAMGWPGRAVNETGLRPRALAVVRKRRTSLNSTRPEKFGPRIESRRAVAPRGGGTGNSSTLEGFCRPPAPP